MGSGDTLRRGRNRGFDPASSGRRGAHAAVQRLPASLAGYAA